MEKHIMLPVHKLLIALLWFALGLPAQSAAQADFYVINGRTYMTSEPHETLTATFAQPDGGITTASYQGYILVHVTGVGNSYGNVLNDAFYLFTGPFTTPQNGHDGGYYQLAFGTSTLVPFSLASNARNFLIGSLPAYNPDHEYTFLLDTRLNSPGFLHFGVTDGGYSDNEGAYTITITQLVPLPGMSGRITLQGAINQAQTLIFDFRPEDGSESFTRTLTLNPDRTFTIPDLLPKRYNVRIKAEKWLAKVLFVDATAGNVTGVNTMLRAGDADNNNIVDVEDLAALIEAFDADPNAPNWQGGRADFNTDDIVDQLDLDLLIHNFDAEGDA
jgi:hypothetical protein